MRLLRCREFQQYHRFISMVIQGVVAALMLLRTYALYGQDRRILVLLLTIIGTGAIISIVCLSSDHPRLAYAHPCTYCAVGPCGRPSYTQARCHICGGDRTDRVRPYVVAGRVRRMISSSPVLLKLILRRGYDLAIAWSAILVFDAVVFLLTLLQALKAGRSLSGSYLRVMLRDGEQTVLPSRGSYV